MAVPLTDSAPSTPDSAVIAEVLTPPVPNDTLSTVALVILLIGPTFSYALRNENDH